VQHALRVLPELGNQLERAWRGDDSCEAGRHHAELEIAAGKGLRLPLVYNSGGYDSPEALALLDGVIDVYMPDMKYGDAALAKKYSHTPDYVRVNQAAVREMHRQVGDLALTADGIAQRGLLVRHLVLPGGIAGTEGVVRFLAEEISRNTWVNIMDQYRPSYRAAEYPELNRMITAEEFVEALDFARKYGLKRLDRRCSESWVVRWP
jgi:putative pyruvate formate lyase activating enzyme